MSASMLSPVFVIGSIRIGSVEGASCINLGNNWPSQFHSHKKHNQGFGTIAGDQNKISQAKASLNDADLLDMLNESGAETPEWVKEIVQTSSASKRP